MQPVTLMLALLHLTTAFELIVANPVLSSLLLFKPRKLSYKPPPPQRGTLELRSVPCDSSATKTAIRTARLPTAAPENGIVESLTVCGVGQQRFLSRGSKLQHPFFSTCHEHKTADESKIPTSSAPSVSETWVWVRLCPTTDGKSGSSAQRPLRSAERASAQHPP